jgi:quercetin dioxygenase-like cupin family protein
MNRLIAVLLCAALGASSALAQQKVEASGITAQVKMEEIIYGHLAELNGKFKLRAAEVTFEPGALLGPHHHAGPGLRYIVSGELTFIQAGKAHVYKAGDYFFESGDVVHTAQNKAKAPLRVIFFEVLPVQWSGPSMIQPKPH